MGSLFILGISPENSVRRDYFVKPGPYEFKVVKKSSLFSSVAPGSNMRLRINSAIPELPGFLGSPAWLPGREAEGAIFVHWVGTGWPQVRRVETGDRSSSISPHRG